MSDDDIASAIRMLTSMQVGEQTVAAVHAAIAAGADVITVRGRDLVIGLPREATVRLPLS